MSGFLAHSIWLTLVLRHARVNAPGSVISDSLATSMASIAGLTGQCPGELAI